MNRLTVMLQFKDWLHTIANDKQLQFYRTDISQDGWTAKLYTKYYVYEITAVKPKFPLNPWFFNCIVTPRNGTIHGQGLVSGTFNIETWDAIVRGIVRNELWPCEPVEGKYDTVQELRRMFTYSESYTDLKYAKPDDTIDVRVLIDKNALDELKKKGLAQITDDRPAPPEVSSKILNDFGSKPIDQFESWITSGGSRGLRCKKCGYIGCTPELVRKNHICGTLLVVDADKVSSIYDREHKIFKAHLLDVLKEFDALATNATRLSIWGFTKPLMDFLKGK